MKLAAMVVWGVAAILSLRLSFRRYRHIPKDSGDESTKAFLFLVGLLFGLFAFALILIGLVYVVEG